MVYSSCSSFPAPFCCVWRCDEAVIWQNNTNNHEKNRNEIVYIYIYCTCSRYIILKKKKWNVPFFRMAHVSFTQRTIVLLFSTRLLLELSLDCRFEMLFILTRYYFNHCHRRWCFFWFLYDDDSMKRERERTQYAIIKRQQPDQALFHMWKIKVFVEHFN